MNSLVRAYEQGAVQTADDQLFLGCMYGFKVWLHMVAWSVPTCVHGLAMKEACTTLQLSQQAACRSLAQPAHTTRGPRCCCRACVLLVMCAWSTAGLDFLGAVEYVDLMGRRLGLQLPSTLIF